MPLGHKLFNFTATSKGVKLGMPFPAAENCPCHASNLLFPCDELVDGHVATTDPTFIKDPYIQELFSYGSKF